MLHPNSNAQSANHVVATGCDLSHCCWSTGIFTLKPSFVFLEKQKKEMSSCIGEKKLTDAKGQRSEWADLLEPIGAQK